HLEKGLSAEAEKRIHGVLKKLGQPVLTTERMRVLEALELLEQLRTAKAIALLEETERDALIPQIRLEARQALQRLAKSQKREIKLARAIQWDRAGEETGAVIRSSRCMARSNRALSVQPVGSISLAGLISTGFLPENPAYDHRAQRRWSSMSASISTRV